MFSVQTVLLACLVVGGLCGGGAGWYFNAAGRTAERAEWLQLEKDRADAAAETARIAAAAETRAAAVSEKRHVAVVARAQGVKREIVYLPRPGCEWADDERMRLQSLHRAYFAPDAAAPGMPGGLHPTPIATGTTHDVGGGDAGLGIRLQETPK